MIEILSLFINKREQSINQILSNLGVFIPLDEEHSLNEQIQYLSSISNQEFEALCEKQPMKYLVLKSKHIIHGNNIKKMSPDLWKKLVEDYPHIAIYFWEEEEIVNVDIKNSNNQEILKIMIDKFTEKPKILLRYPAVWGRFIKEAPEREQDLRSSLLVASAECVSEDAASLFNFSPFKLNLPLEAPLLPHIVNYLLVRSRRISHVREGKEELEFLKTNLSKVIDDISYLSQICNNLSLNQNIRAAATISLLLHPDGTRDFASLKQQLVEFYNPEVGLWYVRAITTCLCLLTTEQDAAAKWIASKLLDAARGDYEGRQYIQRLLTLWRESSYTPIQKAGVQERWLSGA